ncbi:LysR family transcriptional regulator [Pseudohalocynthiibacter aestuariivivens]|nr:LysR family transcriptional regulator [Pseudohalocynthiibacter aestuariivivens]QIE45516.1 LysR family transcriptional regulator [Pseudohalocynthiibacter aestuariivivens]
MNLRQIEIFRAIRSTGSVSAAARQLSISQPALSKALKHAESQLTFKLFDRVKQRLIPTFEAEALFAESQRVQDALDRINNLARNLADTPQRTLRVGFQPSLGGGFAPSVLARLPRNMDTMSFEIFTHHYDQIIERLLSFRLDMGVALFLIPPPGIRTIPVGKMRMVYVEPQRAGMPVYRDKPMRLEQIDTTSLVGLEREAPLGKALEKAFMQVGQDYTPRISVHTLSVAAACAAEGVGPAIIDEFSAHSTPGLSIQPLEPEQSFEIVALLPESRAESRAEAAFIDLMTRVYRERNKTLPKNGQTHARRNT